MLDFRQQVVNIFCCFRFKMKVGVNIENDLQRASTIRDVIGWENDLVSSPRNLFINNLCYLGFWMC